MFSDRKSKFTIYLVLALFLTCTLSTISAEWNENLGLSEVIYSVEGTGAISSVDYSPNGEMLAISTEDQILIVDTSTRNTIKEIEVGDVPYSVQFSSDNKYLYAGLKSQFLSNPSTLVYNTSNWEFIGQTEQGSRISEISSNPVTNNFIHVGDSYNILEYASTNFSSPLNSYDKSFTEELSCLEFDSSGENILAGSLDGTTHLFSKASGETIYQDDYTTYNVIDCAIDPSLDYMTWLVGGIGETFLNVKTYPDGNFVQSMGISGEAMALKWSENGELLHIALNDFGGTIETYSVGNWMLIDKTHLGHRVQNFDYNQQLDELAIATNTKYVTIYANGWNSPHYDSNLGSDDDLDGDFISNNLDIDIDGDGIENSWDVNCESETSSSCSLIPDKGSIRKIAILIDNNVVKVTDSIQFSTQYSSILRELASQSESIDGRISQVENSRVSSAFCQNINTQEVISSWAGRISIQNRYFVNEGDYFCDGLMNLNDFSPNTEYEGRIVLSWSITYNLNESVERPYNITVAQPPAFADGLIDNIIPMYPIRLSISDIQTGKGWDIHPVYKDTDPLTLYMAAPVTQELPSWVEVLNYSKSNVIPLSVSFFVLILSILIYIRSRNRISFELSDEEREEKENRKAIITGTDDVTRGPPSSLGRNMLGTRGRKTPPGYNKFEFEERKIVEPEVYTDYDYDEYGEPPRSRRMRRNEKHEENWDYQKDSRYWSRDKFTDYERVRKRKSADEEGIVKVRKVKKTVEVEKTPKRKRKAPKRKSKSKKEKSTKKSRHKKELPKPIKSTNIPIPLPDKSDESNVTNDEEEEMFSSAISKLIGDDEDNQ